MSIFEEEVGGIIIGGDERRYEFWTKTEPAFLTGGWFKDDAAAIEWFKRLCPALFAAGVEMRVFE